MSFHLSANCVRNEIRKLKLGSLRSVGERRRSSHTLLATERKHGTNAFDTPGPKAGVNAFLCRLWTSPTAHPRPLSNRTASNSRLATVLTHRSLEWRIWKTALGSAIHRRFSCSEHHLLGPQSGRNGCSVFCQLTYPERSFPTYDAAVRGQDMVLALSCFSAHQKRRMPCNIPCSRAQIESKSNDLELEWSVPWRNEGFSGPGTSSSEILVYLRYAAYVATAVPPKVAHWV
jgi:hypothetical protein